ncbi:hypothetical protein [Phenylobacterium montanum]|uniref:Uncharacterized protein n=1 Tax=Phenylobacterium montanum TaxID=2823693 RepID=A0A975FWX9_9CAUL|nr:hypothetical protein [Caulobacter sp. S6]QUD86469.1 hypothetical protein KCG34_15370 [Caulobacter sp. S6]
MSYGFLDIAVTPSVWAVQASMGADRIWQALKGRREFDRFTESEIAETVRPLRNGLNDTGEPK